MTTAFVLSGGGTFGAVAGPRAWGQDLLGTGPIPGQQEPGDGTG